MDIYPPLNGKSWKGIKVPLPEAVMFVVTRRMLASTCWNPRNFIPKENGLVPCITYVYLLNGGTFNGISPPMDTKEDGEDMDLGDLDLEGIEHACDGHRKGYIP